jgi:hypothetical protein
LPKDTDPLTFTIGDVVASNSQQPRPDRTSHPKVHFWRRSDYDTWLDSATVARMKRGTAPYLEEEDGTHVTNATLKSIRRRCRAAWAELVVKKLAPPTWARLCASGQTLMQHVMEKEFPLFRFDADGWKLTLLCTTDYPNWRKRHLDHDGNWKNPDKNAAKREAMGDEGDDDDMQSDSKSIVKKGKKRERTDDSESEVIEVSDKRQKGLTASFCYPRSTNSVTLRTVSNASNSFVYPNVASGSPQAINVSHVPSSSSADDSLHAPPSGTAPTAVHSSVPSNMNTSSLSDCDHDCDGSSVANDARQMDGLHDLSNELYEPDLPLLPPPLPSESPPRHGIYLPAYSSSSSIKENIPVVLRDPL